MRGSAMTRGLSELYREDPDEADRLLFGRVTHPDRRGFLKNAGLAAMAALVGGAVYTAHEGADTHPSGEPDVRPISRDVPIAKAMDPNTLLAFAQNGRPIHPMNGAPLRLVVPGWPGSCSQEWLTRVRLRDRVHDGAKMTGTSYRVPARPLAPGERVDETAFVIIEAMPVKSLITHPATGTRTAARKLEARGHAWAGERTVSAVHLSIDFGATWAEATLDRPVNAHAWQNWRAAIGFPGPGYYEIWTRATDSEGVGQPHAIAWNPKGYLNNALHRVAVTVT